MCIQCTVTLASVVVSLVSDPATRTTIIGEMNVNRIAMMFRKITKPWKELPIEARVLFTLVLILVMNQIAIENSGNPILRALQMIMLIIALPLALILGGPGPM